MRFDESRRQLLRNVALGTLLLPIAAAPFPAAAADLPLLTPDDPTAKALKYTANASKSTDAKPGSSSVPRATFLRSCRRDSSKRMGSLRNGRKARL